MSPHDGADIDSHFLNAEEIELRPLLAEAEDLLDLYSDGVARLRTFLSEAWYSGVRAGHAQMLERATRRGAPLGPIDMGPIETEFQSLMERTAEVMNLTVNRTILAWGLLGRAWIAGTRSYQAEVAARLVEGDSDIGQEALEWIERDQD